MLRLREVLPNTGVPQDDFVVVPRESYNVVWLEGARGTVGISHDSKIGVEKVTSQNAGRLAEHILRHHSAGLGELGRARYQKPLLARLHDLVRRHPGQVFALQGKAPGWGVLKLSAGGRSVEAKVGVIKQSYVEIAFRFLHHKNPRGGPPLPDTARSAEEASAWVDALNWIYGPQANVTFNLYDTGKALVDREPDQPISRDFFLKQVATMPSPVADLTMYLVGDWGGGSGGDARGSYFNHTGIAVVTDAPQPDEGVTPGTDVFLLTMAHEILHFLEEERRQPDGHHGRDRVLLSSGIESLRIDKQLVLDINPP